MKLSKLDKASVIAIRDCMGTTQDESVLIISDAKKREIGLSLFENAKRLGHHSLYVEIIPGKVNGEEPSNEISELMKKFDVVLCPTSTSLTHTDARRNASSLGARIATFPGITKAVMIRGLNTDYNKISDLSLKLKSILENGKRVRITTKIGTDISFSIEGRTSYASKGLFHAKSESGNLPTGETFLAPVEGTSNGIFIVDGSMAGLGLVKNANIKIKVENGYATEITGGKMAKKLVKMLEAAGAEARNIAEFGIGTNHAAKLSGVLLEDEKVLGTIHIALGNNKSMGGSVGVALHLDGVIKKPSVFLDDTLLMKKGKLLI
ncbi:MAG: leucyl aminopeptidase [Ignavibacteria bacterium CG_4_8_14_3_um_filter_37_9]|nr:aminopeptidase [Ignavibacteria bacterium]OIO23870.1 MAG: leucyl aminopeptidase [Ignavibacteria bacterium CG1_02_37_35]PIS45946.1 MAG: leucyl aminopeptidase [Ignavibacteria bacterium CG08_land_8_20_14_0_20_37_9]PIW99722.1 MAG: leucyl aminopeptidase [Ignavibacteria bacterium CG_4_8_14_3_um_filter_37_9]PIX93524.1 MAG: leucyl aminopeptidase [Ignavibacteria bacterium CG_4_10_14_3_um_filter_37_18]